jgi:hypothetical protein
MAHTTCLDTNWINARCSARRRTGRCCTGCGPRCATTRHGPSSTPYCENPKKPVACPRCSGSAHAHVHAGQLHVRAGPLSSVRLVSDPYRRTPRTPSRLGDAPQLFPSTRSPNSITGDSVIGMVTHKDGVNRAPRRTVRQRRCSVPVALAWTFPTPTWKPVRFGYKICMEESGDHAVRSSEDEWTRLVDVGKKFLIERATMQRTTSYTEFNAVLINRTKTAGFNFDLDTDRAAIGELLGKISENTFAETDGLLISALVQYLDTNDADPASTHSRRPKGQPYPLPPMIANFFGLATSARCTSTSPSAARASHRVIHHRYSSRPNDRPSHTPEA